MVLNKAEGVNEICFLLDDGIGRIDCLKWSIQAPSEFPFKLASSSSATDYKHLNKNQENSSEEPKSWIQKKALKRQLKSKTKQIKH
ncbi:hypothetical protein Hdeb2414_s0001g00010841 [Helianthus debilis subsp. tardiflorus]